MSCLEINHWNWKYFDEINEYIINGWIVFEVGHCHCRIVDVNELCNCIYWNFTTRSIHVQHLELELGLGRGRGLELLFRFKFIVPVLRLNFLTLRTNYFITTTNITILIRFRHHSWKLLHSICLFCPFCELET